MTWEFNDSPLTNNLINTQYSNQPVVSLGFCGHEYTVPLTPLNNTSASCLVSVRRKLWVALDSTALNIVLKEKQ